MYVPKHWHFVMPVSAVLFTFWVNQRILGGGFHWDYALFVQVPVSAIAYHWGRFIDNAGTAYQRWITRQEEPEPIEKKPEPGLSPLIRIDGKVSTYAQVTEQPEFSKEKFLAFTLLRMRDNGYKVDLTETRWVKNWQFTRMEFVALLDKWAGRGLIRRAGERKNAPYEVVLWEAVKLIARGNPLPPPPPKV